MKKIVCIVLSIVITASVFSSCNKKSDEDVKDSTSEEVLTEEEFSIKEIEDEISEETLSEEQSTNKHNVIPGTTKKEESTTKSKGTEHTTEKSEPITKPVETTRPAETTKPAETTVPSGNKPYSCGCKNHHCKSPEEHEFVVMLENNGCPYCGSHHCVSFYAVDQWGNNCYDATKCPKYSEKKDPSEYCPHCGKPCGLGDNGTCVRFTVDTVCPVCGKTVPAGRCHSH